MLMSFPPGTEMFQFPGFASAAYGFSGGSSLQEGVAPFGDPRITACSRLPKAFRSVPRPSSPLGAKASTRCPCFPRPPPATTTPCTPPGLRLGGDPARRAHRADEEKTDAAAAAGGRFQRQLQLQAAGRPLAARSQQAASIPMPNARPAADGRRGQDARLAGARRTTTHGRIAPAMPARRAPRHHLTMSKEHAPPPGPNRAGGAQTGYRFGRPGQARATTAAPPRDGEARPGGPGPT